MFDLTINVCVLESKTLYIQIYYCYLFQGVILTGNMHTNKLLEIKKNSIEFRLSLENK